MTFVIEFNDNLGKVLESIWTFMSDEVSWGAGLSSLCEQISDILCSQWLSSAPLRPTLKISQEVTRQTWRLAMLYNKPEKGHKPVPEELREMTHQGKKSECNPQTHPSGQTGWSVQVGIKPEHYSTQDWSRDSNELPLIQLW